MPYQFAVTSIQRTQHKIRTGSGSDRVEPHRESEESNTDNLPRDRYSKSCNDSFESTFPLRL